MTIIVGTVTEIIYKNEINGYTVCELKQDKELHTAVGYMPFINEGETVRLTGKWTTHPDYGEQFKVEAFEKIMPKTLDAIKNYLASGAIKGIGPATADKIVERFGETSLDIIRFDIKKLTLIKGISLSKAEKIGQAFEEQRELMEVVMFFQQYGISLTYAAKIYKAFGKDSIQKVKTNPYKLCDEVYGIGFKTADRIAASLGIDPCSEYRVCSGIKYSLSQAALSGHTYLPEDKLVEYAAGLLEIDVQSVQNALISLLADWSVVIDRERKPERIYLSAFHQAENNICHKLLELHNSVREVDLSSFSEELLELEEEQGFILAELQKTAIMEALGQGVLIITGGPGTGKTTIIKSIIRILESHGSMILLAAPTGRAAKRMFEATGVEASTIHRLLETGFKSEGEEPFFTKNEENPLEADTVIIDEMSMVDTLLFNSLLKALAPGTRLILAGDAQQLPSVGPGNVLKDIIGSGIIKTVRLTEIYRQGEESLITLNAHKINKGEMPVIDNTSRDFFFIKRSGGKEITETIIELVTRRLPEKYGYDPMKHIQVLTPARKGMAGVVNLNAELQKALNPPSSEKQEKSSRDILFRQGDRVMQIRNNYSIKWTKKDGKVEGEGIFNGDTGTIKGIDNEGQKLIIVFEDDRIAEYDYSLMDELEPAFAITVHKSQGSEFPVVIIPMYSGPPVLMTRNLLYTAVTRARDMVIMVGSEQVLVNMINNEKEVNRYTGLGNKLLMLYNQSGSI